MAYNDPWAEFDDAPEAPVAAPAAPQGGPIVGSIAGPPRQPSPQTGAQAEGDLLGVEQKRIQLGDAPLDRQAKEEQILGAQSGREHQRFGQIQSLRQEFNNRPDIRQFHEIRNTYKQIKRLGQSGTPQGDMALVFSFMKSLDPASAVREGEYATAQNATGVPDRVRNAYNKLASGEGLSPEQRQEMVSTARQMYMARAESYNDVAGQYHQLFKQMGEDPFPHIPLAAGPQMERAAKDKPTITPQPLDPEGIGDIGWGSRDSAEANSLPEKAQEFQRSLTQAISAGEVKTAADLIAYGKRFGFNTDPEEARIAAEAIANGVMPSVATPTYEKPDISADRAGADGETEDWRQGEDATKAFVRGIPGAVGLDDEVNAIIETVLGDGTMRENLAHERAIRDYDEEEHPYARFAGSVAAVAAVPSGAVTAARKAAVDALKAARGQGLTAAARRQVAEQAARQAMRGQVAKEATRWGAAHGAGATDGNLADRAGGAVIGAGIGAAAGAGTVAAGQFGGKLLAKLRGTSQPPPPLPLVDPLTGRVNEPLAAARPAERMAAAADRGIDLPMGAAGGRTAAIIEKGLDIVPGSAGVMEDARRGLSTQVEGAVERVAGAYGQASGLDAPGQAAQRGAKNWISRFEEVSSKAYNAIPISPRAEASLTNTQATLERLTSTFESNPKLAEMMRSSRLSRYLDALGEKGRLSWQDLKEFRSRIGDEIAEARFSDSPTRTEMRALYGALSEDMRATATNMGPKAIAAFERANTLYRQGQERIDSALVRILGDDSKNNPEVAARAIQAIAKGGAATANIKQLAEIRASMAKEGEWDEVASALIRLGGQPVNSLGREFSPETFVRWYSDMSEPARNLLFGDRGRKELRSALDGFTGVMQRVAGTNALRNTSNSASSAAGMGAVGLIGALFWNPLLAVKGAAAAGGAYATARIWTSPRFVNWATGYSKMLAGAGRAQGRIDPKKLETHMKLLSRIAKVEPDIADDVLGIRVAVLDAAREQLEARPRPPPQK